jgi:hypothetical protein
MYAWAPTGLSACVRTWLHVPPFTVRLRSEGYEGFVRA